MKDILGTIGKATQLRIDQLKGELSLSDLKKQCAEHTREIHDLRQSFADPNRVSVIAEFKRASPSKGDIAPDLNHIDVAGDYLKNGAAALSILTEPNYFRGDLQFIRDIRSKYPESRILMKDFFVDSYQLYQALNAGADAILIIVGLLGREGSSAMLEEAKSLGLSTLMEVHDEKELDIALDLKPDLLGVNNRDLRDLSISLDTSRSLSKKIPAEQISISESGIASFEDIKDLQSYGYNGFLVGTSLMKTGEPGQALDRLMRKDHED